MVLVAEEMRDGQPALVVAGEITLEAIKSRDFVAQYESLKGSLDELTAVKKEIDSKIKELMTAEYLQTGETKIEADGEVFTLVPSHFQEGFDKERFKMDHPKLFEQYVTKSPVAASLRSRKTKEKRV